MTSKTGFLSGKKGDSLVLLRSFVFDSEYFSKRILENDLRKTSLIGVLLVFGLLLIPETIIENYYFINSPDYEGTITSLVIGNVLLLLFYVCFIILFTVIIASLIDSLYYNFLLGFFGGVGSFKKLLPINIFFLTIGRAISIILGWVPVEEFWTTLLLMPLGLFLFYKKLKAVSMVYSVSIGKAFTAYIFPSVVLMFLIAGGLLLYGIL
ncbi:MAG: hypothetical protein ABH851_04915 [Methanobacteriota archaeon]